MESVDKRFLKGFLSAGGGDISEYEYAGCVNGDGHERSYWLHMQAKHGLVTPEHKKACFCETKIKYNCAIYHPDTKQVFVVGSECINKFKNGHWKRCQVCDEEYEGVYKYCKRCLGAVRTNNKATKKKLASEGRRKMWFGKYNGLCFQNVYESDPQYVSWVLNIPNPTWAQGCFQEYARDRRRVEDTLKYD